MDEVRLRSFLSNSKRSLFEVTKAISNPEKKADKSSVINIYMKLSKIGFAEIFSKLLAAKIQLFT